MNYHVGPNSFILSPLYRVNKEAAGKGKLENLFIVGHGIVKYGDLKSKRLSLYSGGRGIEFGFDNILHSNVHRWADIKNKVENIIVYACAAADLSDPSYRGTDADGRLLMSNLAKYTNADVYAAEDFQFYHRFGLVFGDWEGDIWKFTPSGMASNGATPPASIDKIFEGSPF